MKTRYFFITLSMLVLFASVDAIAAARASKHNSPEIESPYSSGIDNKNDSSTKVIAYKSEKQFIQKKGFLSGFFAFSKKVVKKMKSWIPDFAGRKFLIWCGIFLVATIVFFALGGISAVFNYLGSGAAIATAVFFVLWLVEFTKDKGIPEM